MADVERSIYFYSVEMIDGDEWHRADVLRALDALTGENQVLSLGNDNYTWAKVDHIPRTSEAGRLRFFRDRRANLPGFAHQGNIAELPIPEEAGLIEPTHVVLGGDGLIAAEYNHFAPRIPSHFASLLRQKLGGSLRIGTYVQGSIIEQLDRLEYIQLLEVSLVPSEELEEDLQNSGSVGDAAVALSRAEGGRRINMRLSGDKASEGWTEEIRSFVRRVLGQADHQASTKVLRVTGYDPISDGVEAVDLLKQKLVRRVEMERPNERSKALNTTSAYQSIDDAIREVRQTDLPTAASIF